MTYLDINIFKIFEIFYKCIIHYYKQNKIDANISTF